MAAHQQNGFIFNSDIPWQELGQGLRRKIMAYDDNLMMVQVGFETGAIGTLHAHFHTQMSYVASGVFDITIDGHTRRLKQGDVYHIAPDLIHGALCIEAGILIDIFTPKRDDLLPYS